MIQTQEQTQHLSRSLSDRAFLMFLVTHSGQMEPFGDCVFIVA